MSMKNESNDGKIISFSDKEIRGLIALNPEKLCKHRAVIVDAEKRIIECSVCGAEINPFDYIFKIATDENNNFLMFQHYKKESERLIRINDSLREEERIIKQRISNLKKKL